MSNEVTSITEVDNRIYNILSAQKDTSNGIVGNNSVQIIFNTIEDLQTLSRKNRSVAYVKEEGRGGPFNYVAAIDFPGVPDFGTSFPAQDGGYWVRDFEGPAKSKWYGSLGDGTNDDIEALEALVNNNVEVEIENSTGNYIISRTLNVPRAVKKFICNGTIEISANNTPAIIFGESTGVNTNADYSVKVERSTQSDWLDEDSIGVVFYNCDTSKINVVRSVKNTIGVRFIGDGSGFAYNEVNLGSVINNKIGVDLNSINSGWCNENQYYGGRITTTTGVNTGKSRIGVRIKSLDGSYVNNNNNVFQKPSFELKDDQASPEEALPILIENGILNSFLNIRNELNSIITARILNSSYENIITTGYGYVNVEDLSNNPTTKTESIRSILSATAQNIIFNSGPVGEKSCYYDGSTQIYVPGCFGIDSSSGNAGKTILSGTIENGYIQLASTRGIGVFVDTSDKKRFVIRKDTDTDFHGRTLIRCYDSNGTILTDDDPGHPYVKGYASTPPTYFSGYGGIYRTGSDSASDFFFEVGEDVAYIVAGIQGGTNPLRIKSFSIASVDGGTPKVWTGYDELYPGQSVGSTFPTAGTWKKGKVVYNDNTLIDRSVQGWICSIEGTPGEWTTFGFVGSSLSRVLSSEFLKPISPSSSYDLNTLTDGFVRYNSVSASYFVNAPYEGFWLVIDYAYTFSQTHWQFAYDRTSNRVFSRRYYSDSWRRWELIAGNKQESVLSVVNQNLPLDAYYKYLRGTATSPGNWTVVADRYEANDEIEGEIEGSEKTFVADTGVTIRTIAGFDPIVITNGRFKLKFKTANDCLLTGDLKATV